MAYTSTGTYNDAGLNAADKERVKSLQAQWAAYKAAGDTAGMENAHAQAEAIRAAAGYSGGSDGSEYNAIRTEVPYVTGATSQEAYINQLYDAQKEASLAALKSAYDENVLSLDQTAAKIPGQYQEARNQSSASNQIAKANFNEYASASGLNTGAAGQMQLSMANAEQGNQSALIKAEQEALQEVENQRVALRTNYQNSVAEAIATGNLERAQALYEEAVRVDNSMLETQLQQIQLNQAYAEAQAKASAGTGTGSTSGTMSLSTAKAAADTGIFSDEVLSVLRDNGYSDYMIQQMYGYTPGSNTQTTPNAQSLAAAYEYWLTSGRSASDIEASILSRVNSGEISSATGAETLFLLGLA